MSRSGQQMFFARKRSANEASAAGCFLRESVVLTKCQQHDVGHKGVITGCDDFSLRSPIANPQGVAQFPLQSTYIHSIRFNEWHQTTLMMILEFYKSNISFLVLLQIFLDYLQLLNNPLKSKHSTF
jgi:hypothetical protein